MTAAAVSLRKSHNIVILSFCNIVKGQANWVDSSKHRNDAENLTLLNNIETFIK